MRNAILPDDHKTKKKDISASSEAVDAYRRHVSAVGLNSEFWKFFAIMDCFYWHHTVQVAMLPAICRLVFFKLQDTCINLELPYHAITDVEKSV